MIQYFNLKLSREEAVASIKFDSAPKSDKVLLLEVCCSLWSSRMVKSSSEEEVSILMMVPVRVMRMTPVESKVK